MKEKYDVVIVGTGVAGCFTALQFPDSYSILMMTKANPEQSDSFMAQGGICVKKDANDGKAFVEDTMKAGHYENDKGSVELMVESSPHIIKELIRIGVRFDKTGGKYELTKEGGHSTNRILHYKDITGAEITSKLLERVIEKKNITILTRTTMVDVISSDNTCFGIVLETSEKEYHRIWARYTVMATGGLGGIFVNTTNYSHLTGDAIAIAIRRKIKIKDIDYIQIHPTTLYTDDIGQRFLISESVRGEGAVLLNKDGERFVDELMPRDKVSEAILKQMEKDDMPHVWLSMKDMTDDIDIKKRFPNIYEKCIEEGFDPTKEPIPVVPSQHYLMGGIESDLNGRTSMNNLYAVGETANTGVHGANRLASNSLLESLVFAERAASDIIVDHSVTDSKAMDKTFKNIKKEAEKKGNQIFGIDYNDYSDQQKYKEQQKALILETIEEQKNTRKK